MCSTCGCGQPDGAGTRLTVVHGHDHEHSHDDHEHAAGHGHGHGHEDGSGHGHGHEAGAAHEHGRGHGVEKVIAEPETRTVLLEQEILAKNDGLAAANRHSLVERGISAVNLMSSPGSGKTTLLEHTIRAVGDRRQALVIEGDQETLYDAERIRATGSKVVQINTGAGCHLDAQMMSSGLAELDPPDGSLVFVENVGNLVCPALFDLGEAARVVIISVTEGADKPAKYPYMFRTADLVLLNKIDLLPYVDFDVELCLSLIARIKPDAKILQVSATKGDGMDAWYDWLAKL
ncbi:hydrogenase nickel incorporation protein HypB [Kribbella qitaiheensis]|uniref:Hydrogenase nickel incorporation protein HypB n=1 Tax=Kribbella qitaiheensis TaxID=1544730 RepID=A0A7G6X3R0_9ACTN|nr:hydrogenase nickel incorporation protein HypB [Kribbella qitaiheensis]QNE20875.1 hydrogenase nickel incorporation protein HypB [Kribbella qitaiheensis]